MPLRDRKGRSRRRVKKDSIVMALKLVGCKIPSITTFNLSKHPD